MSEYDIVRNALLAERNRLRDAGIVLDVADIMTVINPYLRQTVPELTDDDKQEAIEVLRRAYSAEAGKPSVDDPMQATFSALLERFEVRKRG
jgi:hypothetical protein